MEAVFIKLLNMSITAAWLILAVLLLRILLRKAPKAMRCGLWALVGIRLICPVSFESVLSLVPGTEIVPQAIVHLQEPVIGSGSAAMDQTAAPAADSSISSSNMPEDQKDINSLPVATLIPAGNEPGGYAGEQRNPGQMPQNNASTGQFSLAAGILAAAWLWLAGVAVMLLHLVISYGRLRHRVKTAMRLEGNLWICDQVESPFILGILFPRVYLPSDLDDGQREAVVAHEKAHLKRHDHWWKPMGYLLLSVYWFNPFIWVAYLLLCRDIELACDEYVVREMDAKGKKNYAEALLSYSIPGRGASARALPRCPLAFGEVGVKARIKAVLNYRKPAFWAVVFAALACIVVGVCFLTNPVTNYQEIFGARYSVGEIVYDAPQYDFTYTAGSMPEFVLTADFAIMERNGINSGSMWTNMGTCEEVDYSYKELSSLLVSSYEENKAQEFLRQVRRVWRADTGDKNNTFYLVMQTKEEQLLLAQGYDRNSESHIRFLFQMEKQSNAYFDVEEFYKGIRDICNGPVVRVSIMETETNPQCVLVGFMAEEKGSDGSIGNDVQGYDIGVSVWLYDAETDGYVNKGYKIFEDESPYRYCLGKEWGLDRDVTVVFDIGQAGGSGDFTMAVYDKQELPVYKEEPGTLPDSNEQADWSDLDVAVSAAILEHYASDNSTEADSADYFCCESHYLLGFQTTDGITSEGEPKQEVTAYCMAMYLEFALSLDEMVVKKQAYYPVALTFSSDSETGFTLTEFWDFRQGREHASGLSEKFPQEMAEKVTDIWGSQPHIDELTRACYTQAVQKGHTVSARMAVGKLFDTIASQPLASSIYMDYITACPQEYWALRNFGDYTIDYIFFEFLKGGQTDLKGWLMWDLLVNLTGERVMLYTGTGQACFDEWLAAAQEMEAQYGMDWMKENKPYQWRILHRLANEQAGLIELEEVMCSVEIPAHWSGKYYIFYWESEGLKAAEFVQKATYDKYGCGNIFSIYKMEGDISGWIFGIPSKVISEVDGYTFACVMPSDVQYPVWTGADEEDVGIAAEYEDMFKDIEDICNSIRYTYIFEQ